MKIETFIMCHNEALMLPYALRHYLQFSDVTILENNSTDGSPDIARSLGAKVWDMHTPDVFDDIFNRNVKNNCWKSSSSDWVIIVDCDEFVYAPNIKDVLENTSATIVKTEWYEMYSEAFPITDGQIYDVVTIGHLGRTKMNLFRPYALQEMNYDTGSHYANPKGDVRIQETDKIKTLHFRHLGMDYIMQRNKVFGERLSQRNKERGISIHFSYPEEKVRQEYEEGVSKSFVVL